MLCKVCMWPPIVCISWKKSITLTHPTHALTFKKTLPPIICTYAIIYPNPAEQWVKALHLLNFLNLPQNAITVFLPIAKISLPSATPSPKWINDSTLSYPCHDLGTPLIFKAKVKTATPPLLSLQIWSGVCLHRELESPLRTWMTWQWQRSEI